MADQHRTLSFQDLKRDIAHFSEILAYLSEAMRDLSGRLERAEQPSLLGHDFCQQVQHNGEADRRRP
jgi:hypothetical protein